MFGILGAVRRRGGLLNQTSLRDPVQELVKSLAGFEKRPYSIMASQKAPPVVLFGYDCET